jgi:hypothetical protein
MRSCFIHVGTHKTGTTALQYMLSQKSEQLATKGYLYPRAGRLRPLPGHHNVAWQLSVDPRYQVKHGTIDDLIAEVAAATETVILSSEDFECALTEADAFAAFIARLQSIGLHITFVLYVRRQADYVPKLFLTLIKAGLQEDFSQVLAGVLQRGALCWRKRVFDFDYGRLSEQLEALPGIDLIVRSYDRVATAICADFLSILGLRLGDLSLDEEVVANRAKSPDHYLSNYAGNVLGREATGPELEAIQLLVAQAGELCLSPAGIEAVTRRFAETNRTFAAKYGIDELIKPEKTTGTKCTLSSGLDLDALFSAEAIARVQEMADAIALVRGNPGNLAWPEAGDN